MTQSSGADPPDVAGGDAGSAVTGAGAAGAGAGISGATGDAVDAPMGGCVEGVSLVSMKHPMRARAQSLPFFAPQEESNIYLMTEYE